MALSWRVAVIALLGVIPVLFYPRMPVVWAWALFVLALTLIDVVLAPSPRGLQLKRLVKSPVRAEQRTTSTLTISNRGDHRMNVQVRDAWPPSTAPTPSRHSARIEPGKSQTFITALVPHRRGTRHGDLVTVRSWGPLRLGARQVSFQADQTLTVLPAFRALRLLPTRMARLTDREGTTATLLRGAGSEFDSLREYVRGDDPRDIDWRASARSRNLVVRTWRPERDRHVMVVIDTGRANAFVLGPGRPSGSPDTVEIGTAPRLDSSMEAGMLLAALADSAGDRVHLVAFDHQIRAQVEGVSGSTLMSHMASSLANVVPSLEPTDWEALSGVIDRRMPHAGLVVIVTQVPAIGEDPELRTMVSTLKRKHNVIIGSGQDPQIEVLASDHEDSQAVWNAAAAEDARRETQAGVKDLEMVGAVVVNVDARLLPAKVADTYVGMKLTGRA